MLQEIVEALFFQASLLLSPLSLIAYAVLVRRHLRRRSSQAPQPTRAATTVALVVFPLALLFLLWRILTDRSSTAVIAIFVLPTLAAAAAGLVFGWVWSVEVLLRALSRGGERRPGPLLTAVVVLVSSLWPASSIARQEWLLRQASARQAAADDLRALAARPAVRKDPVVLAVLAANPSTPPDVLSDLVGSDAPALTRVRRPWLSTLLLRPPGESHSVLGSVARNPATPAAVLVRLASQPSEIAAGVAANPATPVAAFARLAAHPDAAVRAAVALKQSAPAEVLARLARDPHPAVRLTVAANRGTAPSILEALAGDREADTRTYVATNPNTPRSALQLLTHDPDEKVRRYAAQALENKGDL